MLQSLNKRATRTFPLTAWRPGEASASTRFPEAAQSPGSWVGSGLLISFFSHLRRVSVFIVHIHLLLVSHHLPFLLLLPLPFLNGNGRSSRSVAHSFSHSLSPFSRPTSHSHDEDYYRYHPPGHRLFRLGRRPRETTCSAAGGLFLLICGPRRILARCQGKLPPPRQRLVCLLPQLDTRCAGVLQHRRQCVSDGLDHHSAGARADPLRLCGVRGRLGDVDGRVDGYSDEHDRYGDVV